MGEREGDATVFEAPVQPVRASTDPRSNAISRSVTVEGPDRVLLLPLGVEDLWNPDEADLVSLA